MRIIKNKKMFGIFNIFDCVFLLLVIVLFLGCFYRYCLSDNKELFVSNIEFEYIGYINRVDENFINNLKKDDNIYIVTARENTYLEIGKMIDIELVSYKEDNSNDVEFYDVILKAREMGNVMNDDYLTHTNVELHVGDKIDVVTKYTYFEMELIDVNKV